MGVGDRFAQQARAQLQAFLMARDAGANVHPVWNKSHREHAIIGSNPDDVRAAADAAVQELSWDKPYHVDADHIGLRTVDSFMAASDFFTIDVAEFIGRAAEPEQVDAFVARRRDLSGQIEIEGLNAPIAIPDCETRRVAEKFLLAVQEAGKVYRHILSVKGSEKFVTEISMDETDSPQTPPEMLIILAAIADEGIPVQTVAPKFSGRFNKSVDYVGDVAGFVREFNEHLCVLAYARRHFGLPDNLKLSVHSGSDKFSLYAPIRATLDQHGAGLHLKTAGTTWLEELIGLAESGGEALSIAKEIYTKSVQNIDELCAPYSSVIDIDRGRLPAVAEVNGWTGEEFVRALRHEPSDPEFNPNLRQLLHVGYKVAAQLGLRYTSMLEACTSAVARNVTYNVFERHLRPLFL